MSSLSFLLTGQSAQDAIIKDISAATDSILMEMFIIAVDDSGLKLLAALREKARQGVKVRLLLDSVGSFYLYRSPSLLRELDKDGVKYSFFNQLVPWYPKNLSLWYFRNHRRTVIIDGRVSYTGSLSFADHMREWRETVIRLDSHETAADMTRAFEQMWKLSEYGKMGRRTKTIEKNVTYLTHGPVPGRRQLYKRFIKMIQDAKEEVLITTPYFVPDHRIHRALQAARKRNVRIAIVIPRPSNHPYVDWAGDYDKTVYLKMGIEFYFYRGMIHSKTMIVDRKTTLVGSMNLDNISLRYNFESSILLKNVEAAHELRQHFIEDIALSHQIYLPAWEKRPLREKFLMWCMWPFRKLL